MPINGWNRISLRLGYRHIASVTALVLLTVLVLASCGAGASDSVVGHHLGAFFEAFIGRELTRDELRQVTDEFIEFHTQNGQSRQAIRDTAQQTGITDINMGLGNLPLVMDAIFGR